MMEVGKYYKLRDWTSLSTTEPGDEFGIKAFRPGGKMLTVLRVLSGNVLRCKSVKEVGETLFYTFDKTGRTLMREVAFYGKPINGKWVAAPVRDDGVCMMSLIDSEEYNVPLTDDYVAMTVPQVGSYYKSKSIEELFDVFGELKTAKVRRVDYVFDTSMSRGFVVRRMLVPYNEFWSKNEILKCVGRHNFNVFRFEDIDGTRRLLTRNMLDGHFDDYGNWIPRVYMMVGK